MVVNRCIEISGCKQVSSHGQISFYFNLRIDGVWNPAYVKLLARRAWDINHGSFQHPTAQATPITFRDCKKESGGSFIWFRNPCTIQTHSWSNPFNSCTFSNWLCKHWCIESFRPFRWIFEKRKGLYRRFWRKIGIFWDVRGWDVYRRIQLIIIQFFSGEHLFHCKYSEYLISCMSFT